MQPFVRFAAVSVLVFLLAAAPKDAEKESARQRGTEKRSVVKKTTAAVVAIPKGLRRVYVSPAGDDNNSGHSLREALKSPAAAVDRAVPGTAICFDAGTYPPLKISGKHGTRAKPIYFAALPGKERQATFTAGRLEGGVGIEVELCSFVHVQSLRVADSQKGIEFYSVSNCVMQDNLVENMGQEGLTVGRKHTFDGSQKWLGPDSENVQLLGNTVRGTGKVMPQYGEGIYIGTGAFRGDHTHDVVIESNTMTDISAEGTEIKPETYNITFRRNRISNTHHEYNGGLTIADGGSTTGDGNYLVEDNLIWDVHKLKHGVAGIVVGHGNTTIRNNIIWGIEGWGIRMSEGFADSRFASVIIVNNTICSPSKVPRIAMYGGAKTEVGSPVRPLVRVENTYTDDGSAGSTAANPELFVGPLTGDADAGRGPGSGFAQRSYTGIGADYGKILAHSPRGAK